MPKKCSEAELEAVLMAIFDATGRSLNGHVPIEAITKKARRHLDAKTDPARCLKELAAKGYAQEHPTRGSTTYQLTRCGLTAANQILNSSSEEYDLSVKCGA